MIFSAGRWKQGKSRPAERNKLAKPGGFVFLEHNMKTLLSVKSTIVMGLAVAGSAATLQAGGFRLPDQDAFATARGEAFVATADNPSAIFYNPAGITQLEGGNVRAGMYGIYLDPSYQRPGGSPTYNIEDKLHGIPQLFYTYSLKSKDWPLSFGLGVYSPYGLSEKWPQDTGFRTAATEASLTYYTINPIVAYKLPWNVSVAAGLMVNYASIDLQQGLDYLSTTDLFRFKGDAWAVGYNLGLMWQPDKKISLGATFRSATQMNFEGRTDAEFHSSPVLTSPAAVDYPFPLQVAAGISYRPTEKWNVEFDAEYTDWSTVGNLAIHQSSPSPIVPLSNVPVALDWQSSWYYELGATRYFDNGWHISAGYIFNENSEPSAHYTPALSDMDKHFLSLGTGYKGGHLSFDIAYQFGYGPDHTVSGSAAPLGYPPNYHPADGTYSFISHAIAISVGWHF
jgi:long-chain fatty acid transport protein